MKKLLACALLISSAGASAGNTGIGISVHQLDSDHAGISSHIPTVNLTYEDRLGDAFAVQAKIGFGLSDAKDKDKFGGRWDTNIKNTLQVKGMYF